MLSPKKMRKRRKLKTRSWGAVFTGLVEEKSARDKEGMVMVLGGKQEGIML